MVAQQACERAFGLDFGQELALVGTLVAFSAALLYLAGRWRPGSPPRLAAAAAATAVNAVLPAMFCRWVDSTTIVLLSFNFMWISSFKAISWAFNRGALVTQPFNFAQFLVVYAAPVTPVATDAAGKPTQPAEAATTSASAAAGEPSGPAPSESSKDSGAPAAVADGEAAAAMRKGRLAEDAGGTAAMLRVWATKGLFLACMVQLLQYPIPAFLESFCLAMCLMSLLAMIMDGPAAAVIGLLGLRVSPHFDKPWTAKSVSAFWNKHWDLAAGNTLRQLIYDTVCDGSLLPPTKPHGRPSHTRQALGSLASFAASGLVHECIFWHLTGHTTYGVWSSYFLVQVPAIIVERIVLAQLKRRRIMVPSLLRMAYTVGFETLTAQYLFWGPTKKYGVSDSVVDNVRGTVLALAQQLSGLNFRALHMHAS